MTRASIFRILLLVSLAYDDLVSLRSHNPSWRLMTADNAPFIAAFLDSVFRERNNRELSQSDLIMYLEDYLFGLRETYGEDLFPREAGAYLDEWAQSDRGWLRKYYPLGSDEPHYDLTPATEKALQWLESLFERGFIGTESRLLVTFRILQEIVEGVEEDKDLRLERLEQRRHEIERQIESVRRGEIPLLDAREIRERFDQFSRMARELLSDFRAVQHNFRELDRSVRERIAGWTGDKSSLLTEIFGEHDAITSSDQGASFRAFWDFLMSPASQEEFTELLDRLFLIEELGELREDDRLRRIHFDWMSAGEQTQRTVARLSRQLRAFLDDRAFYENRRIMHLLDEVEQHAQAIRESLPSGAFMEIDDVRADVVLPLDRPLYTPPAPVELRTIVEEIDEGEIDTSALFDVTAVNRDRLLRNIAEALRHADQVTLAGVIDGAPLREGLTELVSYFVVASADEHVVIEPERTETVRWTDRKGTRRRATIPRTTFHRTALHG